MRIHLKGAIVECNSRENGVGIGEYSIRLRAFANGPFTTRDLDIPVSYGEWRSALVYMDDPSPPMMRITVEEQPNSGWQDWCYKTGWWWMLQPTGERVAVRVDEVEDPDLGPGIFWPMLGRETLSEDEVKGCKFCPMDGPPPRDELPRNWVWQYDGDCPRAINLLMEVISGHGRQWIIDTAWERESK